MPALATSPYSGFMFIRHYNIVFMSCKRETAPVDTCATNWTYSFGSACRDPNLCSFFPLNWNLLERGLSVHINFAQWHLVFGTRASTLPRWRLFLATGASEVELGEVLGDKSTMHIRVTLYWGYLIVLWLFHLVCILYWGRFDLFCNVWMCVCVGFVMCGCFGNMYTFIYCVLYRLYCVFVFFRWCIFIRFVLSVLV
jgi:hypothetical protein